jgi:hypothetical protein
LRLDGADSHHLELARDDYMLDHRGHEQGAWKYEEEDAQI